MHAEIMALANRLRLHAIDLLNGGTNAGDLRNDLNSAAEALLVDRARVEESPALEPAITPYQRGYARGVAEGLAILADPVPPLSQQETSDNFAMDADEFNANWRHRAKRTPAVPAIGAKPPACKACERGVPVVMVDDHGVYTHVSQRPGTPSHAVDDAWWPCPRWLPASDLSHRCSGCGLRWDSSPSVELCGDCWRTAQPAIGAEPPTVDRLQDYEESDALPASAARAMAAELNRLRAEVSVLRSGGVALPPQKVEPLSQRLVFVHDAGVTACYRADEDGDCCNPWHWHVAKADLLEAERRPVPPSPEAP